jgi:glycosyltransferase involved in cell wall biosynthesis
MNPVVSVIMNCRNGEAFVSEAVNSVLNQSFVDFELIFWDNQSTDSTADIVKGFCDSRIKYYLSDTADSLGLARQKAITIASGRFIAFLDSDDKWSPDKLDNIIPLFNDSEVGLAYSNCILFDGSGFKKLLYSRSSDYATGHVFYQLLSRYFLNLQTVVVRRDAIDSVDGGMFDPSLQVSEEADLFIRISHNWKLAMIDKVLAEYRIHSKSDSWSKTEQFVKDAKYIVNKLCLIYPSERSEIVSASTGMLDTSYWSCAVSSLIYGDSARTREFIRLITNRQFKHVAIYWASYLPNYLLLRVLRYFKYIHTS